MVSIQMTVLTALQILKLSPRPTERDIIKAHRELSLASHPDKAVDKTRAHEEMAQLNEAREALLSHVQAFGKTQRQEQLFEASDPRGSYRSKADTAKSNEELKSLVFKSDAEWAAQELRKCRAKVDDIDLTITDCWAMYWITTKQLADFRFYVRQSGKLIGSTSRRLEQHLSVNQGGSRLRDDWFNSDPFKTLEYELKHEKMRARDLRVVLGQTLDRVLALRERNENESGIFDDEQLEAEQCLQDVKKIWERQGKACLAVKGS